MATLPQWFTRTARPRAPVWMPGHPAGPAQGKSRGGLLALVFQGALLIGVSLFLGVGIGMIGLPFALLTVGLLAGMLLLFVPISWLLLLLLVATYLVTGQLEYFANINRAFWIPYLLGLLLFVRIPIDLAGRAFFGQHRYYGPTPGRPRSLNSISVVLGLFFLVALVASLIDSAPLFQVLVSIKEYLFLWSLFFAVGLGLVSDVFLRRLWWCLLAYVPAQLPVVLYQRFVVSSRRGDGTSWDAVVGLFGGNPEGGGASGAMALFLVIMSLVVISLWRNRLVPLWTVLMLVGTALVCIALAEVKFAILMIPLGVMLLYRREMLHHPLRTLAALVLAVSLSGGLLLAYKTQFSDGKGVGHTTLSEYVTQSFERSSDADFVNPMTGEMSRVAALKYWWQRHDLNDPVEFFLGHGIGASRIGLVGGEVARQLSFRIDRSTLAIYLWEIGVLGVLVVIGLLLLGAWQAGRLACLPDETHLPPGEGHGIGTFERAVCTAISASLLLLILELPYNTDFANVPQMQLLIALMLGQVVMLAARVPPGVLARAARQPISRPPTPFLPVFTPSTRSATAWVPSARLARESPAHALHRH